MKMIGSEKQDKDKVETDQLGDLEFKISYITIKSN